MNREKKDGGEKDALLSDKTHLQVNDKNGYRIWKNRTPSVGDAHDDNLNRKPSRLQWAEESWIRWPYLVYLSFLNPLFRLGYKHTLTDNDFEDISHQDKCSVLTKKLLIYDWSTTTTWRIVMNAFRKETFYAGTIFLVQIIARTAQSLFFRAIVIQVAYQNTTSHDIKFGIVLAFGLYLVSMVQTITRQYVMFRSAQIGIRIRNALSSTIYRHLLSINMSLLQQTTSAQVINLVANDTNRFEEFWNQLHYLWGAPLETIIIFGLLVWIIGLVPTSLAFVVTLLVIPLQIMFSRWFSVCQQKIMNCSDKRIKAYSEILHGCQIMKMYNWEKPMEERVLKMRQEELENAKIVHRLRAVNQSVWFLFPCLVTLPAFVAIWLLGKPLKSADVFTALAFFSQTRVSFVNHMPLAIERLGAMLISSKRIDEFMRLEKKQPQKRRSTISSGSYQNNKSGTIMIRDPSFSWGDNKPSLSPVTIDIESGQLVGITGSVGSGKSSLLAAILGEMNLTNGSIQVKGSLSYAAQSAWIFADTLRANILIGQSFDEERYASVLRACCLDVDLQTFGQVGDLIMIGEKGINLSGGQKARVSLARALYIDADVYLLDEPLAAVDPRVARRIFHNCIGPQGLLKDKTRLVVTHQTHFLTSADQCILLEDGRIKKTGILDQVSNEKELISMQNADSQIDIQIDDTHDITAEELELSKPVADTKSILSTETAIKAGMNWSALYRLLTAPPLGLLGLILLIIVLIAGEVFYDVATYWLSLWSRQPYAVQQEVVSYFYIYLALVLATIITGCVRGAFWFYIILHGAANIHNRMLRSLIYTSMRFFESNSVGRILNRASRDQYTVDHTLPLIVFDTAQVLLMFVGNLALIIIIDPFLFIPLFISFPLFWYYRRYHARTNNQLKQLESATRSPIYAFFSSSLDGLSTIRALKVNDDFTETFIDRIDANTRFSIPLMGGAYWLGLRLEMITTVLVFIIAVMCVIMANTIGSSQVALILMCTLNIAARLQLFVRYINDSENLLTSAERIIEYSELPPEEDNGGDKGLLQTSSDWPDHGSIEFRDYTLRYRPELEPVLEHLNIHIHPNEKIGIVGRTGAGKSSIFQAIFRLVQRSTTNGQLLIDGIDISRLKLSHLRSHLSIIPQTPFLFSHTLRYNLDPFEIYTDQKCWDALEHVQLKHRIRSHPDGLHVIVFESGANFSVGECQLICVARAILRDTKILLIDEATANIDQQTDTLIQAVIRNNFRDRTVLTIAHRLHTVAESDRILVMSHGKVDGFDTPEKVL